MKRAFYIACITTLVSANLSEASVKFCKNQSEIVSAYTVDSLLEKSIYIGLYRAEEVTENPAGKQFIEYPSSYDVHFKLLKPLKGSAPATVSALTAIPAANLIPPDFFTLERRHKEMVEQNTLHAGKSTKYFSDADGNCYAGPTPVIGYSYLIFGGTYTTVTYEPVLDRQATNSLVICRAL